MRLSDDERRAFADAYGGWVIEGESISKTFVLSDFNEALGFVVRLGVLAEKADHHPDIDIRWNKVTIVLTTHDAGGLTKKDTALASAIELL